MSRTRHFRLSFSCLYHVGCSGCSEAKEEMKALALEGLVFRHHVAFTLEVYHARTVVDPGFVNSENEGR